MVNKTEEMRGEIMDDAYVYWLAAFQHKIKRKQYSQVELVEKIKDEAPEVKCTKGHLNAVYRARKNKKGQETRASAELQQVISSCYDYNYLDFVNLGRNILEGIDVDTEKKVQKQPEDQYAQSPERRDPVTSLTQLVSTFRKQEESIVFWKMCLQGIPVPVCVVDENNTVVFQNQADRSLYKMNIVGQNLCPACRGNCDIPHPCDDCAIKKVLEVGEPAEKIFKMKGVNYKIIASPINTPKGAFVVVMVFEENLQEKMI